MSVKILATLTLGLFLLSSAANATIVTTLYGDIDGFGLGLAEGDPIDPTVSNDDAGEAPGTDVRLIGTGFLAPGFEPAGSFDPFALVGSIIGATLTISMGGFDSGPTPVDGPNSILLDGLAVDSSLLDGFSDSVDPEVVETRSIALAPAFFPLLADGGVSLAGTRITEDSGSGSFQIDYLRLDIETVPAPATALLMICGLFGLPFLSRRGRG